MLSERDIKEKIKNHCIMQDGCDLRDATFLENRILGLCESLGIEENLAYDALSKKALESVGIKVKSVNPKWEFID